MKNLIQFTKVTVVFGIVYMILTSCEEMMGNYLDKPPGVDVTEDTIFATQISAERFLVGIYRDGMYCDLPEWSERDGSRDDIHATFCDEANQGATWYASKRWNTASISPNNQGDSKWSYRWRPIRNINTFLDRIEDVPDANREYKDQARGQALFIRGLNYFEMFKRYGGVSILDKRFEDLNDLQSLKVPRATVEELVNFIVKDADEAASLLPDRWSPQYVGKITKGAAMMLKARTLLYAASPLSNTGTPPLSLPGDDNLLICYGNTDVNRWKLAADAAKAVIDWAPSAGIRLLTGSDRSYQDTWEVPDNDEVILAPKMYSATSSYSSMAFKSMNNFYLVEAGCMINQHFVEKYEKKDGTPQAWNRNGGDNLMELYEELDPRFKQSVAYNGSYWNVDFPSLTMWQGAVAAGQPPLAYNQTGYWIRKWVPTSLTRNTQAYMNWHLYRLAEAYLIYAEALNEYQGPVPEAYAAVNIIRNRVGMPDLPTGLTQNEFREKVRNERAIELAFEEHRLWDIIRWCIAEQDGVMRGNMWGLVIEKQPEPSTEFSYTYNAYQERAWKTAMYHLPFMQGEIDKGYLVQNPGW